ncbi:hypothetical protein ACFJIV_09385 [Mucilaginibacter sp. UC70_90]
MKATSLEEATELSKAAPFYQ